MKEESIRLYAISKLSWVKRQIEKIQNQERQTSREYVSGENHYFKGLRYRLNVIERDAPPKVELQGRRYISLYVRSGSTLAKKEEVMREWYREELKQILNPIVTKWENILQVQATYWEVKQMKTLWGSCNTKTKKLIFNLELAKKPLCCIEYIVIHELAHLIERVHNANFTALLDAHLPNWQQIKEELNEFTV
jgi:predicted metal-dependent hydrolase